MTEKTEERAHHPMSPSNWPAWSRCPHFQGGVKSAAADEGTLQHEAWANAVKNGVDEYDSGGAAWAARETRNKSAGCVLHIEDKVEIESSLDGITVKTFGYADAWFVDMDGTLNVIDFKSGSKTAVQYWPQLEGYAVGIAQRLGLHDVVAVKLHILYGADFMHDMIDTTVGACMADAAYILAKRIYRTEADRDVCPQCKWCANRHLCRAASGALETVETDTTPSIALPDAVLLDRFAIIEGIIKSEKERIRNNAIANGGFVESGDVRYEMKEVAGTRKSVDIERVRDDLHDTTGIALSYDELLGACDLGKKDFVDLVRDRAKVGGIKVKQIEDIYNSHVERNPPTQKLVRVTK
jgi:hypothetical protein